MKIKLQANGKVANKSFSYTDAEGVAHHTKDAAKVLALVFKVQQAESWDEDLKLFAQDVVMEHVGMKKYPMLFRNMNSIRLGPFKTNVNPKARQEAFDMYMSWKFINEESKFV